jgi:hypothetical protein
MSIERAIRYATSRMDAGRVARDYGEFSMWRSRMKWLREKVRLYKSAAAEIARDELHILVEENARRSPDLHPKILAYRIRSSAAAEEMLLRLGG